MVAHSYGARGARLVRVARAISTIRAFLAYHGRSTPKLRPGGNSSGASQIGGIRFRSRDRRIAAGRGASAPAGSTGEVAWRITCRTRRSGDPRVIASVAVERRNVG